MMKGTYEKGFLEIFFYPFTGRVMRDLAFYGFMGGFGYGAFKSLMEIELNRPRYTNMNGTREEDEVKSLEFINMVLHNMWKYTLLGTASTTLFPYIMIGYTPIGIYKLCQATKENRQRNCNSRSCASLPQPLGEGRER